MGLFDEILDKFTKGAKKGYDESIAVLKDPKNVNPTSIIDKMKKITDDLDDSSKKDS